MSRVLNFEDWRTIQESQGYIYSPGETLNEGLSDFLHGVADWSSVVSDLIVPGSGAAIDFINALAYFIEAQVLEDEDESTASAVAGLITLGSMALPAFLQAISTRAKGLLKKVTVGLGKTASKAEVSAAKSASSEIVKFLRGIIESISSLTRSIVSKAKELFNTKVGKFIQDKFGGMGKFPKWIDDFFKKIRGWFQKMIDKINKVFPGAGASTDNLTAGKIIGGKAEDTAGETASEISLRIAKAVLEISSPYTGQKKLAAAESTYVKSPVNPSKKELHPSQIEVKRTVQGPNPNQKATITTTQNKPFGSGSSQKKGSVSPGTPFYDGKSRRIKYSSMDPNDIKSYDVPASLVYPNTKDGNYPDVADANKFNAGKALKTQKGL